MIFRRLFNKVYCKKNKYLEEAGITSYPSNHWGGISSFKALLSSKKYLREMRKTGVDPRECWDMETCLYGWVYSNLCQLLKDTNADLSCREFTFREKTYTEEDFINHLKDLCLELLRFDEFEGCPDLYSFQENDKGDLILVDNPTEENKEKFMEAYIKNGERYESLRKEFCDVLYELLPHLWW